MSLPELVVVLRGGVGGGGGGGGGPVGGGGGLEPPQAARTSGAASTARERRITRNHRCWRATVKHRQCLGRATRPGRRRGCWGSASTPCGGGTARAESRRGETLPIVGSSRHPRSTGCAAMPSPPIFQRATACRESCARSSERVFSPRSSLRRAR